MDNHKYENRGKAETANFENNIKIRKNYNTLQGVLS